MMATLPKLKLNRNTSRAIIHGPSRYGGLNMSHVYGEQGNGQLRLLLGHLRNRDHTGELIIIAMSYLQILTGSTRCFLNLPFAKYSKWMERTWLTSIWELLDRVQFTIDMRRAWTPSAQRQGDAALMTMFISSGYKGGDLAQLNRCRVYHQVFFLSDVATADGTRIEDRYRQPERNRERLSQWKWPAQGQPDDKAWELWREALTYFETYGKLRVPLGEWLITPHQRWIWQRHPETALVRHFKDGHYTYYRPVVSGGTRRTSQLYSSDK